MDNSIFLQMDWDDLGFWKQKSLRDSSFFWSALAFVSRSEERRKRSCDLPMSLLFDLSNHMCG